MERYVLSVLVENHAGVLSRVSGLFSRRGYNIDSLTVGETYDSNRSRMTIVVQGDNYILEQIKKQLAKLVEVISIEHCELVEVISIEHCEPANTVVREMALIKVCASGTARVGVIETANIFRAHIVDVGLDSVIIEVTGSEDKIESLIRLLQPFGIMELVRTGLTAMGRGNGVLS